MSAVSAVSGVSVVNAGTADTVATTDATAATEIQVLPDPLGQQDPLDQATVQPARQAPEG